MPNQTWLHRLKNLPRAGGIACVKAYRLLGSPWVGHSCRYQPTCSAYALEALQRYGLLKGGVMSIWRIMRCNPLNKPGYDPVPDLNKKEDPHHERI